MQFFLAALQPLWTYSSKHLVWFLDHCLAGRSEASKYRYLLTVRLLARRLETAWIFKSSRPGQPFEPKKTVEINICTMVRALRKNKNARTPSTVKWVMHSDFRHYPVTREGYFEYPDLAMPDQTQLYESRESSSESLHITY